MSETSQMAQQQQNMYIREKGINLAKCKHVANLHEGFIDAHCTISANLGLESFKIES